MMVLTFCRLSKFFFFLSNADWCVWWEGGGDLLNFLKAEFLKWISLVKNHFADESKKSDPSLFYLHMFFLSQHSKSKLFACWVTFQVSFVVC